MTTALLYARYSPRPDDDENGGQPKCESAQAQLERCRAYCRLRGFDVVAEYADEEVSGARPLDQREHGAQLVELLRKRPPAARHVVVAKLDRGFRNVEDARQHVRAWSRRKIALHIVDLGGNAIDVSTSTGLFLLTLMASVAELERGQTAERTRDAIRRKQRNGRLMSRPDRPPYGWRADWEGPRNERTGKPLNLREVPEEQQIISGILEHRAIGRSYRNTADSLNAAGITCRGRRWNHQTIVKVCKRAEELES